VGKIRDTRDHYHGEFTKLGWFTYPSSSNFLFTAPVDGRGRKGPEVAKALYDCLFAQRILVRYFPSHRLTAPFLRITVGDDAQMLTLRDAIHAWLHDTAR
jgi:histidinol-phosphate aminotransferase